MTFYDFDSDPWFQKHRLNSLSDINNLCSKPASTCRSTSSTTTTRRVVKKYHATSSNSCGSKLSLPDISCGFKLPSLSSNNADLFPRSNDPRVGLFSADLPENLDHSKVRVQVSNNEITIKAEDKVDKPGCHSSISFSRRTLLPPNTDINSLKAYIENNRVIVNTQASGSGREIPVEIKKHF